MRRKVRKRNVDKKPAASIHGDSLASMFLKSEADVHNCEPTAGVGQNAGVNSEITGGVASRNGVSGEKEGENEGNAARNDTARSRVRDANGCLELREGQPCIGSKLDNLLEEELCRYIVAGLTWTDSALLCGIDRSTVHRWKEKGVQDPASRYGRFLERIELAEVKSKAFLIHKVRQADDWRGSWRLLCSRYPREFRDHVVNELTGPDGVPLAVGNSVFKVEFHCPPPDPSETFSVIDHSKDNRLEDPSDSFIKPKP